MITMQVDLQECVTNVTWSYLSIIWTPVCRSRLVELSSNDITLNLSVLEGFEASAYQRVTSTLLILRWGKQRFRIEFVSKLYERNQLPISMRFVVDLLKLARLIEAKEFPRGAVLHRRSGDSWDVACIGPKCTGYLSLPTSLFDLVWWLLGKPFWRVQTRTHASTNPKVKECRQVAFETCSRSFGSAVTHLYTIFIVLWIVDLWILSFCSLEHSIWSNLSMWSWVTVIHQNQSTRERSHQQWNTALERWLRP